jgi:YD repeat-containing protein
MNRLTRFFSITTLFILCLTALSCEDDDGCDKYFLTKAASDYYTDDFYYNDDGTLDVMIQTVDGFPPRRDEYSYDASGKLIRLDVGDEFNYNRFFYDAAGHLEFLRIYSSVTDELSREMQYFYDDLGRVSKREIYDDGELVYYGLYAYPADDKMEVQVFDREDNGTFTEMTIVYTLDNKHTPYPAQYYMGWEAWGGITTPHNVTSYQVFKDGVLDPSQSYSLEYSYNEGGYPTSFADGAQVYTYSCEAVKEP